MKHYTLVYLYTILMPKKWSVTVSTVNSHNICCTIHSFLMLYRGTMSIYVTHMKSPFTSSSLIYYHMTWTNMADTLHIYVPLHFSCSLQINPILLHISIKKQQNLNIYSTSYAVYVPDTNMPCNATHISHMQTIWHPHTGNIPIYLLYIKSLATTTTKNIFRKLQLAILSYPPEQIKLTHCTYLKIIN